jgi:hypothetical protein
MPSAARRTITASPYRQPEPVRYRWELSPERRGEIMPVMGDGFAVQCFGCRKTFSSKGLRCCSATCERNYIARQENRATMEAAGMERLYVRRKCQVCPGEIPRWTGAGKKRRAVPITQVTCSRKCREKLRMAPSAKTTISVVERP